MQYHINKELPDFITLPLIFRDPGGSTELVDANGRIITIHSDDGSILEKNEYPVGLGGIYYLVK